ncbi:hypothetical protein [Laribacter hongkongensis]|uniref:hypothetical protein n=1 Tax=Laribacter hongkongensis TaxID=168471 RepID=UPI000486C5D3|nr:hypothetical protein [Laribacter hongkongensis]
MKKRPAYGNAVFDRRMRRDVLWLLVIGVGSWKAGDGLFSRPDMARVVVLDDFDLSVANWDFVAGLDVLLAADSEMDGRIEQVAAALMSARINSLWLHDGGGEIDRVMSVSSGSELIVEGQPIEVGCFAERLAAVREVMALLGEGIWAGVESPQRRALLERLSAEVGHD